MSLSHIDDEGKARMVDVSEKDVTFREAIAAGRVVMLPETLGMIRENRIKKGDVLSVARIASVMAIKKTPELIPLCHPIPITDIEVGFDILDEESSIDIRVAVKTISRTGVEMEAMVGVLIAAGTIYDMIKGVDRGASITDIRLVKKSGGKSGQFIREEK